MGDRSPDPGAHDGRTIPTSRGTLKFDSPDSMDARRLIVSRDAPRPKMKSFSTRSNEISFFSLFRIGSSSECAGI